VIVLYGKLAVVLPWQTVGLLPRVMVGITFI